MNYPCEMIRDLLPLYHDDVCSPESRRAVEAHCAGCADCRRILEELNTEPESEALTREAQPLAPIRKRWNRERRKTLWIGLGVAGALALLVIGNHLLRHWYCIPMGKDDLVLTSVVEYADGCVEFNYDDLYDLNFLSTDIEATGDGNAYVSVYRPILAKRVDKIPRTGSAGTGFDPDSDFIGQCNDVEKIYLGIKGDPENSILVWEKGAPVPPATAEENREHLQRHANNSRDSHPDASTGFCDP